MTNQIIPLLLVIRNFMSYGNNYTYIPLNFAEPTLILGKNLDHSTNGEIDSNGSGKSAIINALAFAVYGKTIGNKIKLDKLINWINGKNMEVGFHFQKNEKFYFIERYRKNSKKGGDGARIMSSATFDRNLEGYRDDTIAGSIDDSVEKIIGMPFDVFSRIILYSSSHTSFFDLPATSSTGKASQIGIVEELFNISELSDNANILKIKNDNLRKTIKHLSEIEAQIQTEKTRHIEQLASMNDLSDTWVANLSKKKLSLKEKIEEMKKIDFTNERKLFNEISELKSDLINYESNLKDCISRLSNKNNEKKLYDDWDHKQKNLLIDICKFIDSNKDINFYEEKELFKNESLLNTQLFESNNILKTKKEALKVLTERISKISDEITHLSDNKCPYCSQHFAEAKEKMNSKKLILDESIIQKNELDKEILSIESELKLIIENLNSIKDKTSFTSLESLIKIETTFEENKIRLEKLKNELNPHTPISTIDIETIIEEKNEIENKISSLNQKMKQLTDDLYFSTEREMIYIESNLSNLEKELTSLSNETNPHIEIIDKLKSVKLTKSKQEEINSLEDDLEHQEFLYKLLYKKDSFIRKALLAKNLTFLNQMLKNYLTKLGLPHKVSFNYDMSISISLFKNKIDHENLSMGQKARLNLALWAAFRKVREKRYGAIPFCMIDEALDNGLGNVGIQNAAKMIKSIAKDEKISTFVISHKDEISTMFSSKLEIELENKFSKIIKSDIGTEEKTLD